MRPSLTVIDGSGFIYRAFYALPSLTTPNGIPIGAVVGFANMILRWQEIHQPKRGMIVFDCGCSEYRKALFSEYKAHRPPAPPELLGQFSLIKEFCHALNIPILEKAGVEADDLIASIAHHGVIQGWSVDVVTSDKDLFQISGPHITMHDPIKNRSLDVVGVQELWGVRPDQIPHVQALAGDASDGIPGIPGIGIKTATAWIKEFESLQGLIQRSHELKSLKKRTLISQYADQAYMSYQLALLHTDHWDIHWNLIDWHWSPCVNQSLLWSLMSQWQLKTLTERLLRRGILIPLDSGHSPHLNTPSLPISSAILSQEPPYALNKEVYQTIVHRDCIQIPQDDLEKYIQKSGYIVLFLEHHLENLFNQSTQIFACWGGSFYASIDEKMLSFIWQDKSCMKIVHDLKNWMHLYFLKNSWVNIKKLGESTAVCDDLMILSYIIDGTQKHHDLHSIFEQAGWTKEESSHWDVGQKLWAMGNIWEKKSIELREKNLMRTYYTIDRPLISVLAKMEHEGIPIDAVGLSLLEKKWIEESNDLEHEIMHLAGQKFNLASPKQLGKVLFDDLGWPCGKKGKSGAYHTDSEVLSCFAAQGYVLAQRLLEWRQLNKLIHTYAKGLREHMDVRSSRIHTTYSMVATSTGRLSSFNPNLQNIPIRTERGRLLRHQFRAPEDYLFLCLDYSQIELRLLAHMGPVLSLQKAFHACQDIHIQTAALLFGSRLNDVTSEQRRTAKSINFGILYGMSAFGLAEHLNIDRMRAKSMIDAYFLAYPEIQDYLERTRQQARSHGYVQTLWGRRCMIQGAQSKSSRIRSGAERQAINAPLQGTSADIIKKAMIKIDDWISHQDEDIHMILQIHDELVFLVRAHQIEKVRDIFVPMMENIVRLSVPLIVTASFGQTLNS